MASRNIFQAINELDAESIQRVVDRLEYRGKYAQFVQMRETYLERMQLAPHARILDLGCGTGVVARAIAAREPFHGQIVGIDFSSAFMDALHLEAAVIVGVLVQLRGHMKCKVLHSGNLDVIEGAARARSPGSTVPRQS